MSNVRWDKVRQPHVRKAPRIWNWEAYLQLESESFTIFVNNLPGNVSKNKLFHMFKWIGRIKNIYLARKEKYGRIHLFAFIKYTTKGGALKAIKEMNGMQLRSKEIFVGEAKYRRRIDIRKKITMHDEDSPDGKQEKIKEKDIEVNEKERIVLEYHRSEELEIQKEPWSWDGMRW
ncbi:polyadenylate-binding protein, cytoplasmic and nuclear-like [Arachis stenosperma]|uniref:polyadenylate-binding protein, cytoplasmic and nuclear-like n=1 Tax=Arachis stenosperma TaxID=217475 RepID=UPI0025AB8141|nr:polyadenylate-binding protein, cytoplasmic and nuclear-like [Arachis stenosperma]